MSFKGYGSSQGALKVWRFPNNWGGAKRVWRQVPGKLGLAAQAASSMGSVPPTGINGAQYTFKKDFNRWVTWEFRLWGEGFSGNSGLLNIVPVIMRPMTTVSQQVFFNNSYGGTGHVNTTVTAWVDVNDSGQVRWRNFSSAVNDVWTMSGMLRWKTMT